MSTVTDTSQHPTSIKVDDATRKAIEKGIASAERGEIYTAEEAREFVRRGYKAWQELQESLRDEPSS